jgi:alkanesulfonate monooxygenase SsuD/methylene tetrahydromethanopterin reductase-like flavin-dependent oxidoreductase (luciferase family)
LRAVRVGVLMLPTDPWPETVERARRIDALGYDHLWTYDHLSWRRYRDRPWHAMVPWLTGIACATSRIRIGPMVAAPTLRNPVMLAKEMMTLDHVSNGRLVLGLGAGGIGFDATVLGDPVATPAERVARLAEFTDVVDQLLREPEVSYRGERYTVHEARMLPGCVQQPRVPLAIAAGGPKAMEVVARHGDAWITYGDTSDGDRSAAATEQVVRRQVEQLAEQCAAAGRDPRTVDRIYLVGNTDERPLASIEAFADFAGRYEALGFTDIVFHHPRADDPEWDDPDEIVGDIAAWRADRMAP